MDTTSGESDAKTRIMEATYTVLATHGYAGLTTQRVADEAGTSQSLVHYHFDTKEDLVVAFLEHVLEIETEGWPPREGSPEAYLRELIDLQLSIPRDDEHGMFNVAFLELQAAAARNDRYAAALRRFADMLQTTFADVIREGIEAGEFRDVDPEATARFLRDGIEGAVAAALTLDDDAAKEQTRTAIETYVDRVLLTEGP